MNCSRSTAFLSVILLSSYGVAQTSTDAQTVLAGSAAAFSNNAPVAAIQATGTLNLTTDQSETGTFSADTSAKASMFELDTGRTVRKETKTAGEVLPTCSWSGNDAQSHEAKAHNCVSSVDWLFPSLSLLPANQQGRETTFVGNEAIDQDAVIHLKSQVVPPVADAITQQHLRDWSEVQIFIDAKTKLPRQIAFNVHPDNDANIDIPIRIEYSDYRQVNGVSVPFHIQRFQNEGLILDLKLQNVTIN